MSKTTSQTSTEDCAVKQKSGTPAPKEPPTLEEELEPIFEEFDDLLRALSRPSSSST